MRINIYGGKLADSKGPPVFSDKHPRFYLLPIKAIAIDKETDIWYDTVVGILQRL